MKAAYALGDEARSLQNAAQRAASPARVLLEFQRQVGEQHAARAQARLASENTATVATANVKTMSTCEFSMNSQRILNKFSIHSQ